MFNHPHGKEIFSNVQSELLQEFGPFLWILLLVNRSRAWHLCISSPQEVAEINKVTSQTPFLQTRPPKGTKNLLVGFAFSPFTSPLLYNSR